MNAFVFSDNVALEQEVELKREAHERGLIVMGPDCGTAIVGGVPLGFANEVRAGDIGLIGASGTGLQQVSCLIDGWGAGVSQVIGVGSHDLGAAVGGVSMLDALDALAADPATAVLGLVSKPPDPAVAERVLERAAASGKPVVAAFLGADPDGAPDGVTMAATLEDAARLLVRASTGGEPPRPPARPRPRRRPRGERRLLRGLYAGGTFAYEAGLLLEPRLGAERRRDAADRRPAGRAARRAPDPRPRRRPLHGRPPAPDDRPGRAPRHAPRRRRGPADRRDRARRRPRPPRRRRPGRRPRARDRRDHRARRRAARRLLRRRHGADPQGLERQERALRDAGAVLAGSSSAAAALAETMIPTEVAA